MLRMRSSPSGISKTTSEEAAWTGQGFVGVPVTTGAIECFDHVGVLGVAGKRLPVDQADGEFDGLPPGLEADQDDLLAGTGAQLMALHSRSCRKVTSSSL